MKRTCAVSLLLALVTGLLAVVAPAAFARDRDCPDFATQRAAQVYFLQRGGPESDPDRLDADGDGVACDSNPCPCYYGSQVPGSGPAGDTRPTVRTTVGLAASSLRRIAGEPVRWTVSVNPDRRRSVRLERRTAPGRWRTVARGRTSRQGVWRVRRATPANTTTYRAVVVRQTTRTRIYTGATSRLRTLRTQRQRVLLTVPATRLLGSRVTAGIRVTPVRRGRLVVLQTRRAAGRWVAVATGREDRLGRMTRRWTPARTGGFAVRAVLRRRNGAATAVSAVSTLQVLTPPDTTAPAAPTGIVATPGDGQVSVTWTGSTSADVTGYRVYLTSDPFVAPAPITVTGTGHVFTGLTNGVTYYVAVRAVDGAGNESTGTALRSVTPADTTPPAAPTGLVAQPGDGQVQLSWGDVDEDDVAGYRVYYSTTPGQRIQAPGAPVSPDYDLTGLTNGTTYVVVVTAVDESGNESADSAPVSVTPNP